MFTDYEKLSSKQGFLRLKHLIATGLTKLLPNKHCYLCHQYSHTLICEICLNDAYLHLLPSPGHNLLDNSDLADKLVPPVYTNLVALSEYQGIVKVLINQMKFSGNLLAAEVLAILFEHYLGGKLMLSQNIPDAIIPVPLSNGRHISRQYNQARLLSKHLSYLFDIPNDDCLARTTHTQQQSKLDRDGRIDNIKGAFKVVKPIEYTSIAIIDDVMTTGATVNEVCKTILNYNPNVDISVWSMAISLK